MTDLEEKINTDLAQKRIEDNLNLPKHIAKKLDIQNNVLSYSPNSKISINASCSPIAKFSVTNESYYTPTKEIRTIMPIFNNNKTLESPNINQDYQFNPNINNNMNN